MSASVAIIMGSRSDWPTMKLAADRLDQTVSGISRALARLEKKLDTTLLRRTTPDDGAAERAEQRTLLMPRRDQGAELRRGHALEEFVVEQVDAVYPMVPAGADLGDMIRRDKPEKHNPIYETGKDD